MHDLGLGRNLVVEGYTERCLRQQHGMELRREIECHMQMGAALSRAKRRRNHRRGE